MSTESTDARMSQSTSNVAAAAAASSSDVGMSEGEPDDFGLDRKLILEEYKIWKKNAPFLYDTVVSTALEWPSLTVQWLPDKYQPDGKDYTIQRIILGTHTSGEETTTTNGTTVTQTPQNHLMIAEVRLPNGAKPAGKTTIDDNDDDADEGAYGAHSGKIDIVQQINHAGEVNRARYAPHNPNLIATKSPSDKVYIFDKTRHPSKPVDQTFRPDLILAGHECEGYGLAWNPHGTCAGQLLSGSDDTLICLWDVESSSRENKKNGNMSAPVAPISTFRGHESVVEDVAWSHFVTTMFASAGDDCKLLLWDTRVTDKPSSVINDKTSGKRHHTENINCVSFNYLSPHLLASGSSDRTVQLWDLRRLHAPVHTLHGHHDAVFNVSFAPFSSDIIASCAADRRVHIWDLARIGDLPLEGEEGMDDGQDVPPELLFVHGGATDKIADMSWNSNVGEEWMMASVADDNILQIWQSQTHDTRTHTRAHYKRTCVARCLTFARWYSINSSNCTSSDMLKGEIAHELTTTMVAKDGTHFSIALFLLFHTLFFALVSETIYADDDPQPGEREIEEIE